MQKILLLLAIILASTKANASIWTYDGIENGQSDWGNLLPSFAPCNTGTNQSPISILRTTQTNLPALKFKYTPSSATFTFTRATVVTTPEEDIFLQEGKEKSRLKEMLIRTPSEHEIGEIFYIVELQFVHEMRNKQLKIVSVFVKEGEKNTALQNIIDHFPKGGKAIQTYTLDWRELLPYSWQYYAYTGSLSYPPCTEGVEIRILKAPITASKQQIDYLARNIGRSSRAVQPVYFRTIYESGD